MKDRRRQQRSSQTYGEADMMSGDRNMWMKATGLERKWKEEIKNKNPEGQGGDGGEGQKIRPTPTKKKGCVWKPSSFKRLRSCSSKGRDMKTRRPVDERRPAEQSGPISAASKPTPRLLVWTGLYLLLELQEEVERALLLLRFQTVQ